MGAADYRALVPRKPPEGLREGALKTRAGEPDRHGLVYEVEYVQDYGLSQLLDEGAKPRKIKMVRVTCSRCGESVLLNWGKDKDHGYGLCFRTMRRETGPGPSPQPETMRRVPSAGRRCW